MANSLSLQTIVNPYLSFFPQLFYVALQCQGARTPILEYFYTNSME